MYRPQADTWLLAQALRDAAIPYGAHVLDLCTGTGALAVAAARAGARHVTAVDISRRATIAARFNTMIRGLPVRVIRGNVLDFLAGRQFDVVLANPPYVPCAQHEVPQSGLRQQGLKAAIVARHMEPFGPVMRSRIALLERRGLIEAGQRDEELVVIRGDRPDSPP